ncbi:MAG: hypothetical protein PHD02_00890 [Bacilli bacterium]|nr:hypothetical protein [Bacilli bacterium]
MITTVKARLVKRPNESLKKYIIEADKFALKNQTEAGVEQLRNLVKDLDPNFYPVTLQIAAEALEFFPKINNSMANSSFSNIAFISNVNLADLFRRYNYTSIKEFLLEFGERVLSMPDYYEITPYARDFGFFFENVEPLLKLKPICNSGFGWIGEDDILNRTSFIGLPLTTAYNNFLIMEYGKKLAQRRKIMLQKIDDGSGQHTR